MSSPTPKPLFIRLLPIILILIAVSLVLVFDLHKQLSFDNLKAHRHALLGFVDDNFFLALLTFSSVYVLVVTLSIPGATIMTLTGGFLFGYFLGTAVVVLSATIGATIIFMVTKFALGDSLSKKNSLWVDKLSSGFQENAFSYLLTLRFIPLVPFFVLNIVPAILGVSVTTFVVATFIGIIPGSFVYTLFGSSLNSIFESGEEFSINSIVTPEILAAFVGLAIMAMVPVIYKKIKKT